MPVLSGSRLAVLDVETTGWNPREGHTVVEVARVLIEDGAISDRWVSLVGPCRPISAATRGVHGITGEMLAGAPGPAEIAKMLRDSCSGLPLVFHNAAFDLPFLRVLMRAGGQPQLYNPVIDTLGLARGLFGSGGNSLGALAEQLGLPRERAHRALGDAMTTARVLIALAPRWERGRGVATLSELAAASQDALREAARRAAAAVWTGGSAASPGASERTLV